MRLVELTRGAGRYYVVPEQVAWLEDMGETTRIHFAGGGEPLDVDGGAGTTGLKLQGLGGDEAPA